MITTAVPRPVTGAVALGIGVTPGGGGISQVTWYEADDTAHTTDVEWLEADGTVHTTTAQWFESDGTAHTWS